MRLASVFPLTLTSVLSLRERKCTRRLLHARRPGRRRFPGPLRVSRDQHLTARKSQPQQIKRTEINLATMEFRNPHRPVMKHNRMLGDARAVAISAIKKLTEKR